MTDSLLRLPPVPRHDPKKDGNPFAWIVANAPKVREQRKQAHMEHSAKVREQE